MDNSNKTNINLDAPLDISSSDMLVPVNSPTFQHNWQKYQGKYLPNSLRYEQNGWAADWNVYDFIYNIFSQKIDDLYFTLVKQNDNPTYRLTAYDNEELSKEIISFLVNKDFILQSCSLPNVTVDKDTNTLFGKFKDVPFSIEWNSSTNTATLHSASNYTLNAHTDDSLRTTFEIVDDDSAINIDFSFTQASSLKCNESEYAFTNAQDSDVMWSDAFAYNADTQTLNITMYNTSVAVTVIDDSSFTADANINAITDGSVDYKVNSSVYKFVTDNKCLSTTDKTPLIQQNASTLCEFNKITTSVTSNVIDCMHDKYADIKYRIPQWFTMRCEIGSAATNSAELPANRGHVQLKSPIKNTTIIYKTVFDDAEHTLSLSTTAWTQVTLAHRYCKITAENVLATGEAWNPYKYNFASKYVPLSLSCFKSCTKQSIQKLMGSGYTVNNLSIKPSDYYTHNNIFDWQSNVSLQVMSDISGLRSIRRVDDADTVDDLNDFEYISDNGYTDEELLKEIFHVNSSNIQLYSSEQEPVDYQDVYDANGTYIGSTYTRVSAVYSDDDYLWPFEYVPCFNILIDGISTPCYWTDGINAITELNDFKAKVLGAYTESERQHTWLVNNPNYNRTRKVYTFNTVYDFDYIDKKAHPNETEYNSLVTAWNQNWNSWYPLYSSPQDSIYLESSNKYLNYSDIVTESKELSIAYVAPCTCKTYTCTEQGAYNAKYTNIIRVYIFCLNKSNVRLYNGAYDTAIPVTAKIYENTRDVSSMYSTSARVTLAKYYISFEFSKDNGTSTGDIARAEVSCDILCSDFISSNYGFIIPSGEEIFTESLNLPSGNSGIVNFIVSPGSFTVPKYMNKKVESFTEIRVTSNDASKTWMRELYIKNKKSWIFDSGPAETVTFNSGISKIENMTKFTNGSYTYFCMPIASYVCKRIKLKQMYTKTELNNLRAQAFDIIEMPTSDAGNLLFADRDMGLSHALFDIELADISISRNKLTFLTKLKPLTDESYLFFAGKKYDDARNEIKASYYIPGIVFGDPSNTTGNMQLSDELTLMQLASTINYTYTFDSSTFSISLPSTGTYLQHKYYDSVLRQLQSMNITFNEFDFESGTTAGIITALDYSHDIVCRYDYVENKLIIPAIDFDLTIEGISTHVNIAACEVEPADYIRAELKISAIINFIINARIPVITKRTDFSVRNITAEKINISTRDKTIVYNYKQKQIEGSYPLTINTVNGVQNVLIDYIDTASFTCTVPQTQQGTLLNSILTHRINNKNYSIDLDKFNGKSSIGVMSTDIRKCNKTKRIGELDADNEYQLVKQHWSSTADVERFWWIDAEHTLSLTNYEFILRKKMSSLHDWYGDNWQDVYYINRTNLLNNDDYYLCSSAYGNNSHALFLTLSAATLNDISVNIYDPLHELQHIDTLTLSVTQKALGTQLCESISAALQCNLYTYKRITAAYVLSCAKITCTVRDSRLFIGIHCDNNLLQWCVVYNLNGYIERCILGYGFVSVKGDLTGGEIPSIYFDSLVGFNATVQPLSHLVDSNIIKEVKSIDELYALNECIVGTAEQQWYITNTLNGIVSHLEYLSDGEYSIKELPITNKYTCVYRSPSFNSSNIGDIGVLPFPIAKMIPEGSSNLANGAWQAFCVATSYPSIYFLAPRFVSCIYLQQTLGEYAYVHYNSRKGDAYKVDPTKENKLNTEQGLKQEYTEQDNIRSTQSTLLTEEFTFDKRSVTQTARNDLGSTEGDFIKFCLNMLPMIDNVNSKSGNTSSESLNSSMQQTLVNEASSVLSSFAADASDALLLSTLTPDGKDTAATTQVTGVRTLDMFYSTSDKQEIFAGPGFVEHRFVADCVAQSSTVHNVKGEASALNFVLSALTKYQGELYVNVLDAAYKAATGSREVAAQTTICGTGGAGGIPLLIAEGVAYAAYIALRTAWQAVYQVLDVFQQNSGVILRTNNLPEKRNVFNETRHKYGEKNESFMWPCWDVPSDGLIYHDETVNSVIKESSWEYSLPVGTYYTPTSPAPFNFALTSINVCVNKPKLSQFPNYNSHSNFNSNNNADMIVYAGKGTVPYYRASCYGTVTERRLPADMSKVEGVQSFLPQQAFRNQNISVSDPAFTDSLYQDYIIDKSWNLSMTCSMGTVMWVTCKDTKIINSEPSNIVITDAFCGVACSYVAVEVKRGISKKYMRPFAITPTVLAFNTTGYNCIYNNILYHGFDGIGYRLIDLVGTPGLNKNYRAFYYSFEINDTFKRSNKMYPNVLLGNFSSKPIQTNSNFDKQFTQLTNYAKGEGYLGGAPGEDKDQPRFAIPVFSEQVSVLPAVIKTYTSMPLLVIEGVTSLTTEAPYENSEYKATTSVDFTIGKQTYRMTSEYICSVVVKDAIEIVTDLVPVLGLTFIGASPTEAYLYSQATRCYYVYSGGTNITKMDMMERFRNIKNGYYDFINQEVIMPCLISFTRLQSNVKDTDTETDNIIVPILSKNQVTGELPPPITTIFNDKSWYKVVSLPSGIAYQGPNRVIINRDIFTEYMLESIKSNLNYWQKIPREVFSKQRVYNSIYTDVCTEVSGVKGWTHNPFILVTSALGTSSDNDNRYEWTITFCWPAEMDYIYNETTYACVNICAETMTPGGFVKTRPTHIFLTKELFTRVDQYGYYTFKYSSNNGCGNRERLFIWSDAYIAISNISCDIKLVTNNRTSQLTQQVDITSKQEL